MSMNKPMPKELRVHIRTAFTTRVKIMHASFGEIITETRDLSQGGVFLITAGKITLPVGATVQLQTLDMVGNAPLVNATVVRIEADGLAMMFCAD